MAWNVKLTASDSDNKPLSGISIRATGAESRPLAFTDDAGTVTVKFEVDSGQSKALYVSPYRFSLNVHNGTGRITLYDKDVYERLMSKLPLVGGPVNRWRLYYDVTDAASGNPVTGIPAIDPLTGTTLASTPASPSRTRSTPCPVWSWESSTHCPKITRESDKTPDAESPATESAPIPSPRRTARMPPGSGQEPRLSALAPADPDGLRRPSMPTRWLACQPRQQVLSPDASRAPPDPGRLTSTQSAGAPRPSVSRGNSSSRARTGRRASAGCRSSGASRSSV